MGHWTASMEPPQSARMKFGDGSEGNSTSAAKSASLSMPVNERPAAKTATVTAPQRHSAAAACTPRRFHQRRTTHASPASTTITANNA